MWFQLDCSVFHLWIISFSITCGVFHMIWSVCELFARAFSKCCFAAFSFCAIVVVLLFVVVVFFGVQIKFECYLNESFSLFASCLHSERKKNE